MEPRIVKPKSSWRYAFPGLSLLFHALAFWALAYFIAFPARILDSGDTDFVRITLPKSTTPPPPPTSAMGEFALKVQIPLPPTPPAIITTPAAKINFQVPVVGIPDRDDVTAKFDGASPSGHGAGNTSGDAVEDESRNGFYDAGPVALDSITEATEKGYYNGRMPAVVGHTYVVRTYDCKYAKFLVTSINCIACNCTHCTDCAHCTMSASKSVTVQYVYQPDGTRNFEGSARRGTITCAPPNFGFLFAQGSAHFTAQPDDLRWLNWQGEWVFWNFHLNGL